MSELPTATPQQKQPQQQAQFEAELIVQREGLGLLTLKNAGKQPVILQGWPTLQFLGMDGSPLEIPTQNVEIPGEGPQITLKPGTNAFAGVKWEVGDKADSDTFVATTITLTPPNGTKSQVVQLIGTDGKPVQYAALPLKSVQVGTLQPATQGVLAF